MDFCENASERTFNLYHGLNIDADALATYDMELAQPWIDHVKEIVCNGNEEVFDYTIKYFAHLIQKPLTKTNVAFVMRSRQGAGKGSCLRPIKEIFGEYFKSCKTSSLTGEFNSMLRDTIIL